MSSRSSPWSGAGEPPGRVSAATKLLPFETTMTSVESTPNLGSAGALPELGLQPFTVAGRSFSSRLIVGTGKYATFDLMRERWTPRDARW